MLVLCTYKSFQYFCLLQQKSTSAHKKHVSKALSFMLENLNVTIMIDGPLNLLNKGKILTPSYRCIRIGYSRGQVTSSISRYTYTACIYETTLFQQLSYLKLQNFVASVPCKSFV